MPRTMHGSDGVAGTPDPSSGARIPAVAHSAPALASDGLRRRGIAQQALIACGLLVLALVVMPSGRSVAEEDAIAAMMKYARPGEHRAQMATRVGKWKADSTMWMKPGAPSMKSSGTADVREAPGGRYFESVYTSECATTAGESSPWRPISSIRSAAWRRR